MAPKRMWKKKQWKRKPRKNVSRTVTVNKALHPIPQRFITKQKYSTTFSLNALQSSFQFNLNSVFDPDRTGVGHQPYGFDQLAALYNRYRVISCSYVINATAASTIRLAAIPCNDTPGVLTFSDLVERSRTKFVVQQPGGSTQYLKGSCYIPNLVGRSKAQYMADDRYQSSVTGNPLSLSLLHIMARGMDDGVVDTALTITLNYTVEYFDYKQLGQS